jgi:hypothetical protein
VAENCLQLVIKFINTVQARKIRFRDFLFLICTKD